MDILARLLRDSLPTATFTMGSIHSLQQIPFEFKITLSCCVAQENDEMPTYKGDRLINLGSEDLYLV